MLEETTAGADALKADYEALGSAAGICAIEDRIVVRAIGDDRAAFLHGTCSADVKGARPATVLPALILTEHAHVIADMFVWVADAAILLDIDAGAWRRARAHLEKLLVADEVEFDEGCGLAVIDIEGPRWPDAAAAIAGGAARELGAWRFLSANGVLAGHVPRLGLPAASVLAPRDRAEPIVAQAIAAIPGARRAGAAALEAVRIENGIARVGVDTSEKTLALEARLERAIAKSKGCYLGQETIERASAHGALKKRMMGLKFEGGERPKPGAAVSLAGREAGRVTSVAISPRWGAIGLAILHHSAWAPGTSVEVESGDGGARRRAATVSDLPFKDLS